MRMFSSPLAEPFLNINRYSLDDVEVLELEGIIDIYTAPGLKKAYADIFTGERCDVVVEIESIDLDSTGLGLLVQGVKQARACGGSLRLVCTHMQILGLFRTVGLTKVFDIYPSIEDAVSPARDSRP